MCWSGRWWFRYQTARRGDAGVRGTWRTLFCPWRRVKWLLGRGEKPRPSPPGLRVSAARRGGAHYRTLCPANGASVSRCSSNRKPPFPVQPGPPALRVNTGRAFRLFLGVSSAGCSRCLRPKHSAGLTPLSDTYRSGAFISFKSGSWNVQSGFLSGLGAMFVSLQLNTTLRKLQQ